jgi:hypothetical protein
VEISTLREARLTTIDLRWLAMKGYIHHAPETTPAGQNRRTFRKDGPHPLSAKTCVVLTEAGAEMACQHRRAGPSAAGA